MLAEAVEIIRGLWSGERYNHRGQHFAVEDARLYSRPDEAPPVLMAAAITDAATVAGRLGDGLISTRPDADIVRAYRAASGDRAGPRVGMLTVCWARDEATARATAREWWPNSAIGGSASQELARPEDFGALARGLSEAQVAEVVVCGPDPDRYHRRDRFVHSGRLRPRLSPPGRAGPAGVHRLRTNAAPRLS